MFQLFSDIGPPRVEKLKVVEKCQKVEIHLRKFTKLIYMGPIFRCFRGFRVQKVESRFYIGRIFRCFQGVRVRKVESRICMDLIFRCFQGVRVQKVESRFYIGLIFRCFWGSEGQNAAFFGLFRCFNDIARKRGQSLTVFPPQNVTFDPNFAKIFSQRCKMGLSATSQKG